MSLDPWGFKPSRKNLLVSYRSDVYQPILFKYPQKHPQAGQDWEPPPGAEAYFLIGHKGDTQRYDVVITGSSGLLRIESDIADTLENQTPAWFYVSLPDTPESVERMLTKGVVTRDE